MPPTLMTGPGTGAAGINVAQLLASVAAAQQQQGVPQLVTYQRSLSNEEVFRSMKVETTSKTPYSDATQVSDARF